MKLSIIIPTYGRTKELSTLLHSIYNLNLSLDDYEVIVIDQNSGETLRKIQEMFEEKNNYKHINVDFKGLSKAKNYGVNIAKGEFVCFPDDDCEFFINTIDCAMQVLGEKDIDIIFGKCIDKEGKDSVIKFRSKAQWLAIDNFNGGFVEATLFAKREVFNEFKFDETMGAGCFHGAEEGYDWLYRVLKKGKMKVYYDPLILFYHPQVILQKGDLASVRRVFTYRCGFAKLCMKHKLYYKYFFRLFQVLLILPFLLIFKKDLFRYYMSEFLGLISGVIIK